VSTFTANTLNPLAVYNKPLVLIAGEAYNTAPEFQLQSCTTSGPRGPLYADTPLRRLSLPNCPQTCEEGDGDGEREGVADDVELHDRDAVALEEKDVDGVGDGVVEGDMVAL
jgi:hypothetical protein